MGLIATSAALGALHQVKASADAFGELVSDRKGVGRRLRGAKEIRQCLRLIDRDLLAIDRELNRPETPAKASKTSKRPARAGRSR